METLIYAYSKTIINPQTLFFSHFNFTILMAFFSATNFFNFPISISTSNSNRYNFAASFYRTSCPPSPPRAKRRGHLRLKCNGDNKSSMPKKDDDNDYERLQRVHKLFEVIKNKNMNQLSEVLADECPNVYNSIPLLRIFRAQLQVLEFFSLFTKTFGNNLKFTAKPTTKNGSMVGVKWKLGWEKSLVKLGHGVNIQSCHTYVGKLLIGNLERMMDPFVQPANSKELINLNLELKQRRVATLYLGFFLLILALFFFHFSVR